MSTISMAPAGAGSSIFTISAPADTGDYTLVLPRQSGTFLANGANTAVNLSASAPANSLVITAGGNVGLSVASPAERLTVNGTTTSTVYKLFANQALPTSTDAFIYRPADNTLAFGTASTERARIDSSGNFLFGKTAANYMTVGMQTEGQGKTLGVTTDSNSTTFFGNRSSTGSYLVSFYNGNQIGSVATTNGTTVAYNTTSDYRLKTDVQPMLGALARVAALKPVTYKWRLNGSPGEGFIAHELQEVCPEAVTGEKDAVDSDGNISPQGIDTSFLVATLTAAIQEQQVIIESLIARVEALEAR